MFEAVKDNLIAVQNVLVDGGYRGENSAETVNEILNETIEIVKRNELHSFLILPKRWIVDRSFSWLEKCVDYGKIARGL